MKVVAFIIVVCFLSVGAVQAQQLTKPTSSISGRVIYANNGIAGAIVSISKNGDAISGRGLTLKSTTDEDGRFRLANLSAGTYYVWPFVPPYVITEATGSYPMGKAVTLAEAENVEDVDFHLTPGGVITGKVTDAAGRPVINERVHLMPIGDDVLRLATSIYPSINELRTDDRCLPRLWFTRRQAGFVLRNLAPGQFEFEVRFFAHYWYLQSISQRTVDLARMPLTLKPGERTTGVKVTLAAGAATLAGKVETADTQALPAASFVYLVPAEKDKGDDPLRYSVAPVNTDGSFAVAQLAPGRYWLITKVFSDNLTGNRSLRSPDATEARVKLRREAEAVKSEVVLEPCQNVTGHKLVLK